MSTAAARSKAKPAKKPFSLGREIRELAILALIVLGVHSFVAKPFYIPSESMLPGLLIGDRLLVTKFPYGYSYVSPSLPIIPPTKGRLFGRLPTRGDVVVVTAPDGNDWIKRVIGLPGDTVKMTDGQLFLNGKAVPKIADGTADIPVSENTKCTSPERYEVRVAGGADICRYPRFTETLPNGRRYEVLDTTPSYPFDTTDPVVVPEGMIFLMGDNRDNSSDSRVPPELGGLGLLPIENLRGRAEFITFSLDGSQVWWNPVSWVRSLRGGRAGNSLHPQGG